MLFYFNLTISINSDLFADTVGQSVESVLLQIKMKHIELNSQAKIVWIESRQTFVWI